MKTRPSTQRIFGTKDKIREPKGAGDRGTLIQNAVCSHIFFLREITDETQPTALQASEQTRKREDFVIKIEAETIARGIKREQGKHTMRRRLAKASNITMLKDVTTGEPMRVVASTQKPVCDNVFVTNAKVIRSGQCHAQRRDAITIGQRTIRVKWIGQLYRRSREASPPLRQTRRAFPQHWAACTDAGCIPDDRPHKIKPRPLTSLVRSTGALRGLCATLQVTTNSSTICRRHTGEYFSSD
ncbi:hypothetical protein CBL_12538 [Carabus blaptoides fortunei]